MNLGVFFVVFLSGLISLVPAWWFTATHISDVKSYRDDPSPKTVAFFCLLILTVVVLIVGVCAGAAGA